MAAPILTTTAHDLLLASGARATPAREGVLEILLAAPRALAHQDIEQTARERGLAANRVTLYRVLDWLVAQGLAHKIASEDRVWRFNAAGRGEHGHAHFHCTRCGQVFCLDELKTSFALSLPTGYRFERAELTIQGLCPHCTQD